jgi:hypothetical protein
MSPQLEKFGNHVVKSDLGWTVDTSAFWFFLYRDATVEAKVAVEGAGTFLSPCLVGFSTMEVKKLKVPVSSPPTPREEIQNRISAALKLLKIRVKVAKATT